MKKTIYRILAALLLMLNVCQNSAQAAEEIPKQLQNLYARSAVLLDGNSGRILFGKNENDVMPMASTTKIMTCILALENGNLRDVVSASAEAARQPEVHLGVRAGEEYYLEDMLYALMLESFNDSAVVIAEHIAGSVEAFADMMNEKAVSLGCENTHYVSPNGLDAEDEGGAHSTTAAELARIMAYCVSQSPEKEEFLHITQTRSHSFTDVSGSRSFSCQNHNSFLDMMEGAISGKTGFTSAAGYCYVGALERDGRLFIVALLACGWPYNRNYKWSDTRALMTYGLENYVNHIIQYSERLDPIPVEGGLSKDKNPCEAVMAEVKLDTSGQTEGIYLLRNDERIRSHISIKKKLTAPVEKGTVVGKIGYYLEDELLEEYPIVTTANIEARYFEHWFWWVCERYLL